MDLLKAMVANRRQMVVPLTDPVPRRRSGKKPTKTEKAKEIPAGTKAMREFVIDEKPPKKVVKEHLEAIVARECESSSDSD
jgi:hypothetical protein